MKTIYYNLFFKSFTRISKDIYKVDGFLIKIDEFKYKIHLSCDIDTTNKFHLNLQELIKLEIYLESLYFVKYKMNFIKTVKAFRKFMKP